uniref:Uncharacterized protein n=1 Tax=Rhizophora mucronata TaxID=61149 RepID=A0A2P2NS59_RHIMU
MKMSVRTFTIFPSLYNQKSIKDTAIELSALQSIY